MRALFLVAIVLLQLPQGMPAATQTFKVSGRVLTSSGEPLRGKNHLILIGYGDSDHSTNGTYVRPGPGKLRHLHREEFLLDGSGDLSLGRPDGPPIEYKIS